MTDIKRTDAGMDLDADKEAVRKPHWRMLANPAHFFALGFGMGLSPRAPGTVATLGAWAIFSVFNQWLTPFHWGILIALGLLLGVYVCERTGAALNSSDHGAIVWDEIIAFWLVLLFLTPGDWGTQCWAFLWFRLFDITKPGPIRYLDSRLAGPGWRGSFGVMVDDILAAFFTLLLFAIWRVV